MHFFSNACFIFSAFINFSTVISTVVSCLYFKVKQEWSSGEFKLQPGDEDIHTANERRLKVNNEDAFSINISNYNV